MPTLPLQSDSATPSDQHEKAPVTQGAESLPADFESYLSKVGPDAGPADLPDPEDWASVYEASKKSIEDEGPSAETLMRLCNAAQKLNLVDEVEFATREILAREPRNGAALLAAARNAHLLNKSPDVALARWQAVLGWDADHAEAFLRTCQCFLELEDHQSAREYLTLAIKTGDSDHELRPVRTQLADALEKSAANAAAEQDWLLAEEWWRAVLDLQPGSVRAGVNLATALQKQGRFEEAEQVLETDSRAQSDELSVLVQLARGAHLKQDWEGSVSRWRAVLVDHPNHYEALYKLGEALTYVQDYAEAEQVLELAATCAAGKLHWRRAAAVLAEDQGRWSDALEHWSAMVDGVGYKKREARKGIARCKAALGSGPLLESLNTLSEGMTDDASLDDAPAVQSPVDAYSAPEAGAEPALPLAEDVASDSPEGLLRYMLAENDFSDLLAVLREALAEPGFRTDIILQFAKSLPREELSTPVLELLRTAGESSSADSHLQLAYAIGLLKTRRFWEAEARLQTLVSTPELDLMAARCRSEAAEGLRAWRVAAKRWQEVLSLDPSDGGAMMAITECWLRLENPNEVLKLIGEHSLAAGGLHGGVGAFCRGKAFAAMKSYAEARDAFTLAGSTPSQRESLLALVDVNLRLGDALAAERQLATLSKSGEYDGEIGLLWVRLFCLNKRFMDASNALVRMHASEASDALLAQAARHLAQNIRTVSEARSAVAIVLAESLPRFVSIEFAAVWSATPLYQQAELLLQTVHAAAPKDISSALALMRFNARIGKLDEAKVLMDELASSHPENVKVTLARHRFYREFGTAEEILSSVAKLERLPKQSLAVLQELAQSYVEAGDLTKGHQYALSCVELDPHNPIGHRRLGEIAFAEMKIGYAVYCLERLIGLRQNADDTIRLADAYFAQGETDRAQNVVGEALRNNPYSAKLHRKLKELLEASPGPASALLEEHQAWLQARLSFSGPDFDLFMVHVHMAGSEFDQAILVLERALTRDPQNIVLLSLLGEAHRQAGNFAEAIATFESILELTPFNGRVALNMALAYCESGEFNTASEILERTRSLTRSRDLEKNVVAVERELSFAQGNLRRTFQFLGQTEPVRVMRSLDNYVHHRQDLAELNTEDRVLFVSTYGIGDEVRWASAYHDIIGRFPNAAITCEPRLFSLLSRSFPNIRFVPAKRRMREAIFGDKYNSFEHLPHVSLVYLFDNPSWKDAQAVKKVSMVSDALAYFRPTLASFKSRPAYLIPDPAKRRKWRYRLRSLPEQINVGISWRSSVQTGSRNTHYTDLTDWGPIFATKNINFVSVQYDDCTAEVAAAREKFGVDIHQFSDIDLKDDFEATSALLGELDLVIAPCSTMAELAAAVGTTTYLTVNSPLHYWRSDRNMRDLWHGSMEVIRGDQALDKSSLIKCLSKRLDAFCRDSVF